MKSLQHKDQRVAVFLDVQNLYYSAKHLFSAKVNYREILRSAVAGRCLIRAIAYAITADMKDEHLFHEALEKIGIEVKAKEVQVFYGGAKKGDWDIGIAMDAVRIEPKVDTVVLVSGDGDFKDLLSYLKGHGCRVEVMAFGQTTSRFLKEDADDFFDLSKHPKFLLGQRRTAPRSYTGPPRTAAPTTTHTVPRETTKEPKKKEVVEALDVPTLNILDE